MNLIIDHIKNTLPKLRSNNITVPFAMLNCKYPAILPDIQKRPLEGIFDSMRDLTERKVLIEKQLPVKQLIPILELSFQEHKRCHKQIMLERE